MVSLFARFWFSSRSRRLAADGRPDNPIDYDRLIMLDAEDLSEQGIAEGYREVLPELSRYSAPPREVLEIDHPDSGYYAVRCGGLEYVVTGLEVPPAEMWDRAAYALFDIVNRQLCDAPVRLYALSGGNDLCGVFLTPEDAEAARRSLTERADWPYLPEEQGSWHRPVH